MKSLHTVLLRSRLYIVFYSVFLPLVTCRCFGKVLKKKLKVIFSEAEWSRGARPLWSTDRRGGSKNKNSHKIADRARRNTRRKSFFIFLPSLPSLSFFFFVLQIRKPFLFLFSHDHLFPPVPPVKETFVRRRATIEEAGKKRGIHLSLPAAQIASFACFLLSFHFAASTFPRLQSLHCRPVFSSWPFSPVFLCNLFSNDQKRRKQRKHPVSFDFPFHLFLPVPFAFHEEERNRPTKWPNNATDLNVF